MSQVSEEGETLSRSEQVGLEVKALLLGLGIPTKPGSSQTRMPIGTDVDSGVRSGGLGAFAHCSGVRGVTHARIRWVGIYLRIDLHGCSTLNESNWIERVTKGCDRGLAACPGQSSSCTSDRCCYFPVVAKNATTVIMMYERILMQPRSLGNLATIPAGSFSPIATITRKARQPILISSLLIWS